MSTLPLTPEDVALHARLRIPPDLLRAAQVRRLTHQQSAEVLSVSAERSRNLEGIEYPYISPITGRRVTSRVRLDTPPLTGDGTPDGKYRSPWGDRRHLYFPPGVAASLSDRRVHVVLVEAEKSALALTASAQRIGRRVVALALGGCWNWKGVIGKGEDAKGARVDIKGPLPDFTLLSWDDRLTTICFDARPNSSVNAARFALARELRKRGADIRHAYLDGVNQHINGPDDFIGECGDLAFWALIDRAGPETFARNQRGQILRNSLNNIRLGLRMLDVNLVYDAFSRVVLVNGKPLDDRLIDSLWVRLDDDCGFQPTKEALRTLLVFEAQQATAHPVRDYLDQLVWDGIARLNDWLVTYGGATSCHYTTAVSPLPLIAAVRRVRSPGCKFDELLILESGQGTMKSSALRALCPREEWFSDDLPLGADAKHVIERTTGKWIIEAAEMYGVQQREVEQLKAFLSRQEDGPVRLAYDRLSTTVARQFILLGTTNAMSGYLRDTTGARRFWPVRVERFDTVSLRRDRDQLWAEAAAREAAGESIRLDPDLWATAAEEQEQRRAIDPWEDVLEPVLADAEEVSVEEIWSTLGVQASARNNRDAERVTHIMQNRGFYKTRRRKDGHPLRVWKRVTSGSEL
jgi:hypothetical protein